jgi:hypothetical protein
MSMHLAENLTNKEEGVKIHMVDQPFEESPEKPEKTSIFKRMGANSAEVQRKRQRTEAFFEALGKHE